MSWTSTETSRSDMARTPNHLARPLTGPLRITLNPRAITADEGLPVTDPLVDWWWTSITGPTSITLLRMLNTHGADTFDTTAEDLAAWVGLTQRKAHIENWEPGKNHPIVRTLIRMYTYLPGVQVVVNAFDVSIIVPTRLGPPPPHLRKRWPHHMHQQYPATS